MSYHTINLLVCDGDKCKLQTQISNNQNLLSHRTQADISILEDIYGWMKLPDGKHLCPVCAIDQRLLPTPEQLSGEKPYGRRRSDIQLNQEK